VSDLLDLTSSHLEAQKTKDILHKMGSLLPFELKGVESLPPMFDIKASVDKVKNFLFLRTKAFMLQESFKIQAKHEEEQ